MVEEAELIRLKGLSDRGLLPKAIYDAKVRQVMGLPEPQQGPVLDMCRLAVS
jgi:hypothetical protein